MSGNGTASKATTDIGLDACLISGSIEKDSPLVFGGGLTGLSAAHALAGAGSSPMLFEAAPVVGGLSRTIHTKGFRYDIGGHRFFTRDPKLSEYVARIMGDELLRVERTSKIFLWGKFFDYPLKPMNAMLGLGPLTVSKVMADYAAEKAKGMFGLNCRECVSLEDWVVRNFGRTMFEIYFKVYSEKVWGIDCKRISSSWVEKRIQGLSLGTALKNAFFRLSGRDVPSLVDEFDYPALGIGRLSDRIEDEVVSSGGSTLKDARLVGLKVEGDTITGAEVDIGGTRMNVSGNHYLSTVPLDGLVRAITPAAPDNVLRAADSLGYRDLLTVALAVDKDNVTGESWVYIPEDKYLFGRLHEPRNWSAAMAPEGKTLVVVEFFCFKDDHIWSKSDDELHDITVKGLVDLGFISPDEVLWSEVLRVPHAYPLFEIGYEDNVRIVMDYLMRFRNLTVAGRAGTFAYLNMDHAIRAGMTAADEALRRIQTR